MKQTTHWAFQSNPLLENIPAFNDPSEFAAQLAFHPTKGLDLKTLSFMDRIAFLSAGKMPLEPTAQVLRTAFSCYGMLIGGLRNRNPVLAENKKLYWAAIHTDKIIQETISPLPLSGVSSLLIRGPAGTGKTVTVQRLCSLLPQIVVHGPHRDAGWCSMTQLVYLYTTLSSDGSRGGFLIHMLVEMDNVLGTQYAIDLPRRYKRIEHLAVAVTSRLVAHYTGILFIDEGQLRNLMHSAQASVMQVFLLSLMNTGIPIVLMGNELAFDWIDYSQDWSRMITVPPEYFHPIGAITLPHTETDWQFLFIGISSYYLMPSPFRDPDGCSAVLRKCSGGIARLALILWCTAQTNRLYAGAVDIGPEDILAAYNDRRFNESRALADGFHHKNPILLMDFKDVAYRYYRKIWGYPDPEVEPELPSTPEKSPETDDTKASVIPDGEKKARATRQSKRRSEVAAFEAAQTREENKQKRREKLKKELSPDDLRQGLQDVHLAGLEEMRQRHESASGKIQDSTLEESS